MSSDVHSFALLRSLDGGVGVRPTQLNDALCAVPLWSTQLLASLFFADCKDPLDAAEASLNRRCRSGLLRSRELFAIHPPASLTKLLYVYEHDKAEPRYGQFAQLAWMSEKHFATSPKSIRVWWATRKFGKRFGGSWVGRDSLPKNLQIGVNHELLCAATWLQILKRSPAQALNCWRSEAEIQHYARRKNENGSLPDGLICEESGTTAIEVLGRYPANYLAHKIQGLRRFDRIELWGVRL